METTASMLIITSILTLGLILILRPVMLWYWKINRIEDLLEEQINLIKLLNKEKLSDLKEDNEAIEYQVEGVVFNFPDYLKYKEIDLIKTKALKLKKGQLLSIHNITHEVEFWNIKEYKESTETLNTYSIVAFRE
jgi:hypothetical protein